MFTRATVNIVLHKPEGNIHLEAITGSINGLDEVGARIGVSVQREVDAIAGHGGVKQQELDNAKQKIAALEAQIAQAKAISQTPPPPASVVEATEEKASRKPARHQRS